MSAACTGSNASDKRCMQALAAGWILLEDLCPACLSTVMRALERTSVEPLAWHPSYARRAEGESLSGEERVTVDDVIARQTAMDFDPGEYPFLLGVLSSAEPEAVYRALDILDKCREREAAEGWP